MNPKLYDIFGQELNFGDNILLIPSVHERSVHKWIFNRTTYQKAILPTRAISYDPGIVRSYNGQGGCDIFNRPLKDGQSVLMVDQSAPGGLVMEQIDFALSWWCSKGYQDYRNASYDYACEMLSMKIFILNDRQATLWRLNQP